MQIQSSAIQSQAHHSLQQTRTEQQTLQFWTSRRSPATPSAPVNAQAAAKSADKPSATAVSAHSRSPGAVPLSPKDSLIAELIRRMIKAMTGKDWEVRIPENLGNQPVADAAQPPTSATPQSAPADSAGYGLTIDHYESFQEAETLVIQANGKVTTADGKQIEIALNLSMARSYQTEQHETDRFGDAARIDPLVVNLGEGGVVLDPNEHFQFDLNADGKAGKPGCIRIQQRLVGFGQNGDGRINDGNELFGALSGDGFADLAGYDEDGNGFIDDGDRIFAKLRIWLPEGKADRTLKLADAGIGALYLDAQEGRFRLTDSSNQGLGEVKSSGLYLREDGSAGTLQQIDYLA